MQDSGSLAVFKVTARDQDHYKGPSGAFVTYCNISCLDAVMILVFYKGFGMICVVFGPHSNLLKIAWFLLPII